MWHVCLEDFRRLAKHFMIVLDYYEHMGNYPSVISTLLIDRDPYLGSYSDRLQERYDVFTESISKFDPQGGILGDISQSHHYFGFNRGENHKQHGVWFREWAPNASKLTLFGDLNGWNREANPLSKDEFGVWHTFFPDAEYAECLTHGSLLKLQVDSAEGRSDRLATYSKRVVQNPTTLDFSTQYWLPDVTFSWHHPAPPLASSSVAIPT